MERLDRPQAARQWSLAERVAGRQVAIVPTMGALHEGHLSLIELARQHTRSVIVSIFVNPLQFDSEQDLQSYPRNHDRDLAVCRDAGVAAVYEPGPDVMYPVGFDTRVVPGDLAHQLEGAHRPGHFEGVTTIVAKLLAASQPDIAVFGRKDYQQLAVIRRLALDLDLGVRVVAAPTCRASDGLALSSRNERLSDRDRRAAPVLYRGLMAAARSLDDGVVDTGVLEDIARAVIDTEPRVKVEYLDIVDANDLTPLSVVDRAAVMLLAAHVGGVRLIDNIELPAPRQRHQGVEQVAPRVLTQ